MHQVFSRFAIYFDEVGRRGSVRAASERLRIAPSAIDRQILAVEKDLEIPLFERLPTGLRPTAAGELLLEAIRRWRRDLERVRSQIDSLRGLKRGEVDIALVDGAGPFLAKVLPRFRERFPGIAFHLSVGGGQDVIEKVVAGEVDIGLAFNPDQRAAIRIERSIIFQLGAVIQADHPLASRNQITFRDCADFGLIIPDDTMPLRQIIEKVWSKSADGPLPFAVEANSVDLIKGLVRSGIGVGMLTAVEIAEDVQSTDIAFKPLSDAAIDLSALSLVTAARRTLSAPASVALQHLLQAMIDWGDPTV